MKLNVNCHSSIQIDNIYFDPYKIETTNSKAKYIFLTHTHYDHLSIEDIDKIISPKTIIIAPNDAREVLESHYENKIIYVKPNQNISLTDLEIETLPAYNINKKFHPKKAEWVGYKIIYKNNTFAILGDTDSIPELKTLSCDYLFIPIGGTYTMTALEASDLANLIKPKFVIPVHYNLIIGTKEDEDVFFKNLSKDIKPKILI